jgi:hypothetical protein
LNRIFESILWVSRSSKFFSTTAVRRPHQTMRMTKHKPIHLSVLVSSAACVVAACSSAPQPQLLFWQQSSTETVAGASNSAYAIEATPNDPRLISSEEGWGTYSGARGQTMPPSQATYIYRGYSERNTGAFHSQM